MPAPPAPAKKGQVAPPVPPSNLVTQTVFNAAVKIHSIGMKVQQLPFTVKK